MSCRSGQVLQELATNMNHAALQFKHAPPPPLPFLADDFHLVDGFRQQFRGKRDKIYVRSLRYRVIEPICTSQQYDDGHPRKSASIIRRGRVIGRLLGAAFRQFDIRGGMSFNKASRRSAINTSTALTTTNLIRRSVMANANSNGARCVNNNGSIAVLIAAVAYYRMSSDKQEASIPEQRKAVIRWAKDTRCLF